MAMPGFTCRPLSMASSRLELQKYPPCFKSAFFPSSSSTYSFCNTNVVRFCFAVSCKIEISKDEKQGKKNRKKEASGISPKPNILVPKSNGAPPVSEAVENDTSRKVLQQPKRKNSAQFGIMRRFSKRVLSILSNFPLAIAEMFAVAGLMALGTIIDQGEAPEFYFQKYSEDNPLLGFFTWRWVLTLGFDHMYSSPFFLGTLALFGTSLMACTYTRQIPLVKVARRWSFLYSAEAIRKQEYTDTLPQASIKDLGVVLMGAGYEV